MRANDLLELFTPERPRRDVAVVWTLLAVLAVGILSVFNPAQSQLFPPCPFRAFTGFDCPGCGSTRALHQLLHGDVAGAVALNPLLLVFAPILGYALLSTVTLAARGRPLPRPRISARWIWALLAMIMLFWVVRNTPWWR